MGSFLVYGIIFYIGAIFIKNNGLTFTNLMTASFTILFGAYGAGTSNY